MGATFGISVDGLYVIGSVPTWNGPHWFNHAEDVIVFQDHTAFPPTALLKTLTLPSTRRDRRWQRSQRPGRWQ